MSRNHDKCIFFHPFFLISRHICWRLCGRSDATAAKVLDGAGVGGKGSSRTGFYSEWLDMVWEFSEECHEAVHPPDSRTLSAGSIPL